jgi:hypothetical protein
VLQIVDQILTRVLLGGQLSLVCLLRVYLWWMYNSWKDSVSNCFSEKHLKLDSAAKMNGFIQMNPKVRLATAAGPEVRLWGVDNRYGVGLEWDASMPQAVEAGYLTFDGSVLVLVMKDSIQAIRVDSQANSKPIMWKIKRSPDTSYCWMSMSRQDRRFLCAGLYNVTLLDAVTGTIAGNLFLGVDDVCIACAVLSGDGSRVVTGHHSLVCVRDASGPAPTLALLASVTTDGGIRNLSCSVYASNIAFVKDMPSEYHALPQLELWHNSNPNIKEANIQYGLPRLLDVCSNYSFNEEGSRIVTVSTHFLNHVQLKIWDTSTGIQLQGVLCEGIPQSMVIYDEVGIVVGHANGKIEIFDVNLNCCLQVFDAHAYSAINMLSCAMLLR